MPSSREKTHPYDSSQLSSSAKALDSEAPASHATQEKNPLPPMNSLQQSLPTLSRKLDDGILAKNEGDQDDDNNHENDPLMLAKYYNHNQAKFPDCFHPIVTDGRQYTKKKVARVDKDKASMRLICNVLDAMASTLPQASPPSSYLAVALQTSLSLVDNIQKSSWFARETLLQYQEKNPHSNQGDPITAIDQPSDNQDANKPISLKYIQATLTELESCSNLLALFTVADLASQSTPPKIIRDLSTTILKTTSLTLNWSATMSRILIKINASLQYHHQMCLYKSKKKDSYKEQLTTVLLLERKAKSLVADWIAMNRAVSALHVHTLISLPHTAFAQTKINRAAQCLVYLPFMVSQDSKLVIQNYAEVFLNEFAEAINQNRNTPSPLHYLHDLASPTKALVNIFSRYLKSFAHNASTQMINFIITPLVDLFQTMLFDVDVKSPQYHEMAKHKKFRKQALSLASVDQIKMALEVINSFKGKFSFHALETIQVLFFKLIFAKNLKMHDLEKDFASLDLSQFDLVHNPWASVVFSTFSTLLMSAVPKTQLSLLQLTQLSTYILGIQNMVLNLKLSHPNNMSIYTNYFTLVHGLCVTADLIITSMVGATPSSSSSPKVYGPLDANSQKQVDALWADIMLVFQHALDPINLVLASAHVSDVGLVPNKVVSHLENIVRLDTALSSPQVLSHLLDFLLPKYQSLLNIITKPIHLFLRSRRRNGLYSEQIEANIHQLVQSLVKQRNDHVENTDASQREHVHIAQSLIVSAVQGGSLIHLVQAAPLQWNEKSMILENSWILPLIRNVAHTHVTRCASLGVFETLLLPVITTLNNHAQDAAAKNTLVLAKNLRIMRSQVIALMPVFCFHPVDLHQNLSATCQLIHELIAEASTDNPQLSKDPELLSNVMLALRNIAASVQTSSETALFSKQLKKLFPKIFIALEKVSDDKRKDICDTVTACSMASKDNELLLFYLSKAMKILLKSSIDKQKANENEGTETMDVDTDVAKEAKKKQIHTAINIGLALIESKCFNDTMKEISQFYRTVLPFVTISQSDSYVQKKAYNTIASMMEQHLISTTDQHAAAIIDSSQKVCLGAKASRIKVLGLIVGNCKDPDQFSSYSKKVLPELVLSTHENSVKTRTAATSLILSLARSYRGFYPADNTEQGLIEFVNLVIAGLAGQTPWMIGSTLGTLARLLYEFRAEVVMTPALHSHFLEMFVVQTKNTESLDIMETESPQFEIGIVGLFLRHDSREVVRAALSFIKVACVVYNSKTLCTIAIVLFPSLIATFYNPKSELKIKVKAIIERLLKKCGREFMEANFPEEHRKILNTIRKARDRKIRKKEQAKLENANSGSSQKTGFELALDGDESEDEESADDNEDDAVDEVLGQTELGKQSRKRKSSADVGDIRVRETQDGDAFDLLDAQVMTTVNAPAKKRPDKSSARPAADDEMKFGPDGRPIFVESDSDQELSGDESGVPAHLNEAIDDGYQHTQLNNSFINDKVAKRQKKRTPQVNFGEEYKSKRAKGDVKRAGRPDPFAYIPLGATSGPKGGSMKGSSLYKVMKTGKEAKRVSQSNAKRRRT